VKKLKHLFLSVSLTLVMVATPVTGDVFQVTASAEASVYVTPTGKKYHKKKCGNGTYTKVKISKAKARGLTPCKKCYG
jgi:hypothetical protein